MQLHEPSLGWNPRNQIRHPHGYHFKSLDLAKEKGKTAVLEAALRAAGIDPNNISGFAKRSGSLEEKSESEEESATKVK